MRPHRFYVPVHVAELGSTIDLPAGTSRQITHVLRLQSGDEIVVFDGTGPEWTAQIVSVNRESVKVVTARSHDPATEPHLRVTVCQALVPAERMEFVIQKGTELGAARFIPIVTERVQAKDANPAERRIERWGKIAVGAAEQSGRTCVPEILPAKAFESCVSAMCAEGPVLLLWEEEHAKDLRTAVRESLSSAPRHVTVLVGPVGGLSAAEVGTASENGALIVGAGPRILRAETAPVVALAALMYEAGELS
jgi:16S rRNA (uracil1498-N3)-methyltransferase